jgi:hypothetical protein
LVEASEEKLFAALDRLAAEREDIVERCHSWLEAVRAVRDDLEPADDEREPVTYDFADWIADLLRQGLTDEQAALCAVVIHPFVPRIRQVLDLLEQHKPGVALTIVREGRRYNGGRRYHIDPEELASRRGAAGLSSSALARLVAGRTGATEKAVQRQLEKVEAKGAAIPAETYGALAVVLGGRGDSGGKDA